MIEEIKILRVQIDGLAQLTKGLKPCKKLNGTDGPWGRTALWKICNSKEIEKAVDSLYLAKAWLGIILKELGNKSPYPKDGARKTVEDIEPTADVAKNLTIDIDSGWEEINHIERIDYLRQEIQKIIDTTADFSLEEACIYTEQEFIYKYLCEARFWLGFELSRVKNENKQ